MPYDEETEREKEVEKRARGGRDEQGNLIRQPPPPAPVASAPVRFGRPFTAQEKARQADALIKKLRSTGDY